MSKNRTGNSQSLKAGKRKRSDKVGKQDKEPSASQAKGRKKRLAAVAVREKSSRKPDSTSLKKSAVRLPKAQARSMQKNALRRPAERPIELPPELNRDPRIAIAAELLRAGDRDGAKDFYIDILNDSPGDARAATALARIGIASKDTAVLRTAIMHADVLSQPVLASCVGLLLRAGEFDVLRDMVRDHPDASAEFVPAIVRSCRKQLRDASISRKDQVRLYRDILDMQPDDKVAKSKLARLFKEEISVARSHSGRSQMAATELILTDDPRNAAAAQIHAKACIETGDYAGAYEALARLDDSDLAPPRTSAAFMTASKHSRSGMEHAADLGRLFKIGQVSESVMRGARAGLRKTPSNVDPLTAIAFADLILSALPRDEQALRARAAASANVTRQLQRLIREGDAEAVESVWKTASAHVGIDAKHAALRLLHRMGRDDSSREIVTDLLAADPDDGAANAVKAAICHKNGDYGGAVQSALIALKSRPHDETLLRIVRYAGARAIPDARLTAAMASALEGAAHAQEDSH